MNTGQTSESLSRDGAFHFYLLSVLALFSGACALAYEVLFMRALSTALGDMYYVNAALLSTFLIGMAIGSRQAWRATGALPFLQIGTGLFAFLLPGMIQWLSAQRVIAPITASPLLTVIATALAVILPSLLIGFSVPLFSAYAKCFRSSGSSFQGIYTAYNLGAVLSILVVELCLVRHFGISSSLFILGGVNVVVGAALLLMRLSPPRQETCAEKLFSWEIILALFMASLCSAVFQMFFMKLCYHVFSPQRENFAVALSVILAGVFIGSAIASRIKIPFRYCLLGAVLTMALLYCNFHPLQKLYLSTLPLVQDSVLLALAHKMAFAVFFALLPMTFFGALIPALMYSENDVARESGALLFISGVANAIGYLLYVFVGHPFMSGGVLLVAIGTVLLISTLLIKEKWSVIQISAGMVCVVALLVLSWVWQDRFFYLSPWVDKTDRDDEVKIFKSGGDSATLIRTVGDLEWISYNGHVSIVVRKNGRINAAEMISGVIPALYAPRHEKALVIGLGTGISSGVVSTLFQSTDVVDLNRAFFLMLPEVSYANFNIAQNRSVSLCHTDGRAFLIGKEGVYDAILNTAEAPDYFAAYKLYTVEFYQRAAKALKSDGVFCTWLSTSEMSEEGVVLVLSALRKSFTYFDLTLLKDSYCQITCSNQPLHVRKLSEAAACKSLERELSNSIPGFQPDEYFDDIRISENPFVNYHPIVRRENTDDYPALEFCAAKKVFRNVREGDIFCQNQSLFNIDVVKKGRGDDAARLARRALAVERAGSEYFRSSFIPLLESDENLRAVYFRLKEHR
ncbi:MAG: hypothetical protein AB9903_34115 [Vulcanimicrobiota bacterium]